MAIEMTAADHADVRVIPPLLYAVPLGVGVALDAAVPLTIPGRPATAVLGGAVAAGGALLVVSAVTTFRRRGTTVLPHHPVAELVTTGPFRLTRNPMYVGLAGIYTGTALLVGTWWPLALLPLVLVAVDRLVIAREEPYLARRFGAGFEAYRRRVRRWL
jgi:protein-S-isoprenylcysteine O-methyltransferase Ste14